MVVGMGGRSSVDGNLSRRVGELVSHFLLLGVVADGVACRTLCVFLPVDWVLRVVSADLQSI